MKKSGLTIAGAVIAIVVLAGAAFVAMRLLNGQGLNVPGLPLGFLSGGSNGGKVTVKIELIPAPELPTQEADLRGQVTSIQGNSVFIAKTDNMMVTVQKKDGPAAAGSGNTTVSMPTPSGPSTEIVITKDTKIWRDVTDNQIPAPGQAASTQKQVQQKVEPGTQADITQSAMATVWGQKRGDRMIADVIVIMGIPVISNSKK